MYNGIYNTEVGSKYVNKIVFEKNFFPLNFILASVYAAGYATTIENTETNTATRRLFFIPLRKAVFVNNVSYDSNVGILGNIVGILLYISACPLNDVFNIQ